MIDERFVIVGAVINMLGIASYVVDTIKGRVRPNRVTWFLWTLAPLVAFSAEVQHGVGLTALLTFTVGFGPLCVLVASFVARGAPWKLTKLDACCGILSIAGLALWQLTGSGSLAILCSILADGLAAVPTVAKSFKEPESESWPAFLTFGISALITLLALRTWDFAHVAFPLYIFILYVLLVVLVAGKLGPRLRFGARMPVTESDETG